MAEPRRGRGRPPTGRVQISIHMHPEVIRVLDAARTGSRSEAIERAVHEWLARRETQNRP